jgi:hypothetical protein
MSTRLIILLLIAAAIALMLYRKIKTGADIL